MDRPAAGITTVRIIAVGDELLEGRTADTNSGRIQRALGSHAVQCAGIQVVPDQERAIAQALDRTEPGDLVFLTGGLGSTPDDLTRDVVAGWAGVPLEEDPGVRRQLEERWLRRGVKVRPGVTRQCQVPRGLRPLENPVGSAPGLMGRLRDRHLVLLPGVPQELSGLLPLVVRGLEESGDLPEARSTLLWRTAQIAELTLVKVLDEAREKYPELAWSWWLTDWGVDLRLAAPPGDSGAGSLAAAGAEVDAVLGHLVYARQMQTLPETIQEMMIAGGLTLAVAESCTAGLLGARFTDAPGSSGFFRGGVLAYADGVKRDLLGVPAEDLQRHGAVSESVVRAMAAGCRKLVDTDFALAVSGISGPDGGTEEKPVGTTWIAVATPDGVFAGGYRFPGDRERNRLLTVAAAADTLRRVLQFGAGGPPWYDTDTWCRHGQRGARPPAGRTAP
jgi:nicotinamide-nucleotide amidase